MNKQEEKIFKIENFMKVGNFFLLSSGLELYTPQPVTQARRRKLLLLAFIMIGNLFICTTSEIVETIRMYRAGNRFREATTAVIYIFTVFIAYFKIYVLFRNKMAINDTAKLCVQIFPQTLKNQHLYQVRKYLRQSTRYTLLFSVLYMLMVWTINLLVLGQYFILDLWLKRRKVGLQLPFYPYVPWDYQHHWSYVVLYILEAMAGYTTVCITVSSDLILCAFVIQLVMHFDFLTKSIAQYKLKSAQEDLQFLSNFVKYQNFLYK